MTHNDFAVEPVEGLPERPPAGEIILWQGRPAVWALARDAMKLYWIVAYFVLLATWRVGVSSADMGLAAALPLAIPFLVIGLLAMAILLACAWILAHTTVYTVTTARVAMRVGAALTVTLNLPFTRIGNAALTTRADGTGTIAFETLGGTRLSYLVLWPHARPWHLKKTQPALRSIPDAARVAAIVADAAETRISQPEVSATIPDAIPAE
jgi:hypothetical protein